MIFMTFFWGILSAIGTAFYLVLFKKQEEAAVTCIFWNYIFLFFLMLGCFYLRHFYAGETFAVTTTLFQTTLTENFFWYLCNAVATILSIVFYAYAFSCCPVSQIIPIVQLGVIFVTATYYFLGTSISPLGFTGVVIISIGAIISGFDKLTFPNILKPLTTISPKAYLIGFLIMITDSIGDILVYLATYKDSETFHIDAILGHMKGIHHLHFAFTNALQYYEASLAWLILMLFFYLVFAQRYSLKKIFKTLTDNFKSIMMLTLASFGNNYIYLYAYQQTTEKSLLVALTQFSIPLTMVLAYFYLKEKINLPEKVGAVLIVLGGLLSASQ